MWVDKEMEKPTYVHSVQGGNESKLLGDAVGQPKGGQGEARS